MKVRMLSFAFAAAEDGIRLNTYHAGEKYDLPEPLAEMFIAQGKAEEDKDMGHAPEIKRDSREFEYPWGPAHLVEKITRKKREKKLGGKRGHVQ
jgi:hypothetical protein